MENLESEFDKRNLNSIQTGLNLSEDVITEIKIITELVCDVLDVNYSFLVLFHSRKNLFFSHDEKLIAVFKNYNAFAIDDLLSALIYTDINTASIDNHFLKFAANELNINSISGTPIHSDTNTVLGILFMANNESRSFDSKMISIQNKFGKQISSRLINNEKNSRTDYFIEELNKKIQTLEVIQDSNKIGTWELDIQSGKTKWSPIVYEIYEVSQDFDHNRVNGLDYYHPDYHPLISKAVEEVIQEGKPFDLICKLISEKGTIKWVRSTGKRVDDKIIGSFQDISELKSREIKFEGIFNSTLSFIGFLDTNGILLEANDTALNVGGIKREDVIGKYFWDCHWWQINEQTQNELRDNFNKAKLGEEIIYEVEVNIANEKTTTILFSLRPVFDEMGNVIYIIPEGRQINELVKTRDRFKAVIEGTNVGIWEWNVQSGVTVFNERWAEIIGYKLSEIEPTTIDTWIQFAHPDDLNESNKKIQECFDRIEEYYEIEVRMQHKLGHWVWIYDRGKVIEWTPDGKPLKMYGTHQDITQRKNRELKIRYQKQILDSLYELSPIGIALNDFETGQYIGGNKKLLEPTGYSELEFLNLSYWDLTPKEYQRKETIALEQMKNNGFYEKFEKEYIRKDGSRYPVALNGVVINDLNGKKLIWSFIEDISKQKENERIIKEAKEYLQAILDASTQIAIIATDANGIIKLFNSGSEKMLGYKAIEVLESQTTDIFHLKEEMEDYQNELAEKYKVSIKFNNILSYEASLGNTFTKEWTYKSKDGSLIPVLISYTAIKNNEKNIGFLGIATDISDLKSTENKAKALLKITQEQNNKLKNFAFIVSHNLRSHSGGILALMDLLKIELPDIKNHELVNMLDKGAKNLKKTVDDLTEIVKINLTESSLSDVNIYDVVQKNIESLLVQSNKSDLKIENELDKNLIVKGVPVYLDSMVLNFITNAIKYARKQEASSYLRISYEQFDTQVALSFQDNGQGIDLNKYGEKLFGMYQRFHEHEDSRGLGLFITKNQIENMEGKIEVFSEVNVGTTFLVYLKC